MVNKSINSLSKFIFGYFKNKIQILLILFNIFDLISLYLGNYNLKMYNNEYIILLSKFLGLLTNSFEIMFVVFLSFLIIFLNDFLYRNHLSINFKIFYFIKKNILKKTKIKYVRMIFITSLLFILFILGTLIMEQSIDINFDFIPSFVFSVLVIIIDFGVYYYVRLFKDKTFIIINVCNIFIILYRIVWLIVLSITNVAGSKIDSNGNSFGLVMGVNIIISIIYLIISDEFNNKII